MITLISKILRDYAKERGIKSPNAFSNIHGFPQSTFNEWWNGHTAPGKIEHRQKLFELTKNPLFNGTLTEKNKQLLLAVVEESTTPATAPPKEDQSTIRAKRLASLIQAANDDLTFLIMTEDKKGRSLTRQLVKKSLGDQGLTNFSVNVRALTTETTRSTLLRDGMIQSEKKEEVK
jgi:hypothetical protein